MMAERRTSSPDQTEVTSAQPDTREWEQAARSDTALLQIIAERHLAGDEDIKSRLRRVNEAFSDLRPEAYEAVATEVIVLTQLVTRGLKEKQPKDTQEKAVLANLIKQLREIWHSGPTREQSIAIGEQLQEQLEEFNSTFIERSAARLAQLKHKKEEFSKFRSLYGKLVVNELSSDRKFGDNIESFSDADKETFLKIRLRQLEDFAKKNGGVGVGQMALQLFPEIKVNAREGVSELASRASHSPFPDEAPIKWKDREPGETPPDFVRRAYGPWLKEGISKRVLRNLDPTLITELSKWAREGNAMPDDVKILTVREENRQLLDAGPEAIREHLGKFTGAEAVREARRLTMAKHRSK